jgi:hypothetical protein
MCIYCTTNNYRKIYEHHHGAIPKDDQGRSYHIHHIDGNHSNNDPDNLIAVSIKDHYDIHLYQGDYGACFLLAPFLSMTAEDLSNLARIHNKRLFAQGKHIFQNPEFQAFMKNLTNKRVQEGTHNFVGGAMQRDAQKRIVSEGKHPFQKGDIQRNMHAQHKQAGTHFSQREDYRKKRSQINKLKVDKGEHTFVGQSNPVYKELEKGTHNFLGGVIQHKRVCEGSHHLLAANRKKVECEHCGIVCTTTNYTRWHGQNCKKKPH